MMRLSAFLFLIVVIVNIYGIPHHTPDHANHCHFQGPKELLHIELEHSITVPETCQKVTCEKGYSVAVSKCPNVSSECKVASPDASKEFPECCENLKC